MQEQLKNIPEGSFLYDNIVIDGDRSGKERTVSSWFSRMEDFAEHETHTLFKGRTVGLVGLTNTNMKIADKNANPFYAFSPGICFNGPGINILEDSGRSRGMISLDTLTSPNLELADFWQLRLPRMCGLQIKIGQYIVAEGPAENFPACYGPYYEAGYTANTIQQTEEEGNEAASNFAFVSGDANLQSRRQFIVPEGIPKDEAIEMILIVSREAREILKRIASPYTSIPIQAANEEDGIHTLIPARFSIEGSFLGVREVQKRGELRFPGQR
jgi:hypothetical protein